MKPYQIYMGWDPREQLPFDVARESIRRTCPEPLCVIPLKLKHLTKYLRRPIQIRQGRMWDPISDAPMSTEFAISRFVIPFLQKKGWALFCDCDILCWENIAELFALADPRFAVQVVKHEHAAGGKVGTKMDGQVQTYYNRKNWSSIVLWNCEHEGNKRLDEMALNGLPGRDLHAFCWLNDREIGTLPQKWNWLVDVTPGMPETEGIWHYTIGGPWFDEWSGGSQDEEWEKCATLCATR